MTCKWAEDSQRFILEYFDIICDSPSEIYHRAIPFSPSSSWLHEFYGSEFLQGVKVVKGLQTEWGTCSRTVFLNRTSWALACWKDLIALGCDSGDIIILDAITGIYTSILSNHSSSVNSVVFSLNGTFLVSGSSDRTISLWDIQTGGVIRTFHGHTSRVYSVSISLDCTMIASGSFDHTIHLWDAQTGECHCIIQGHSGGVYTVCFSPTNPQILLSASRDGTVRQWDIDGHQIGPTCEGDHVAFSPDGTCFISWRLDGRVAIVWDSKSGGVITELQSFGGDFYCCCWSPDGKYVAGCIDQAIYIWSITGSDPCLVGTFIGHADKITSLAFSSLLVSSSVGKSVKFWQTGILPMDTVTADSKSIPPALASIHSVSLQATDGIAISSDSAGVVKIWDILTELCKESLQTPAGDSSWRDTQLIDGRLILVWLKDQQIHIWDTKKGESFQTLDVQNLGTVMDFRISGDKSNVIVLNSSSIQAWSIWTGEVVGKVTLESEPLCDSLVVSGSRVWVYFKDLQVHGWDFGFPEFTPVPLSNPSPDRPHLCFIGTELQNTSPSRIEDPSTRKVVFQLYRRYAKPWVARWDGRHLVAGYESGEVLILDLNHMITQ